MKLFRFNLLLLLVNVAASFSSLLWGTVFFFDEYNRFSRGALAALPFVVSLVMLLEFLYFGVISGRHSKKQEPFLCIVIFCCCVFSAVMETLHDCKGLVTGIAIASVVFYYMYFLVKRLSHDQLTDVYLRNRFYSDVERVRKKTFVISIDLNGLKSINDRSGHFAGDKALCDFADAVLRMLPTKAALYRIGGDEFAVLYQTDKEKNVAEFVERIRKQLEGSAVSFSAGYAHFAEKTEFSKAFEVADERMYTEKRQHYLGKRGILS